MDKIKNVNYEVRVVEELSNPRWVYRSAEGISRQTKIPEDEVREILDNTVEIRKSLIPGENGSSLYVLKSRKTVLGDVWQAFRSVSSAKVGVSEE